MRGSLIDCHEHGQKRPAYVCAHSFQSLDERKPRPFFWTDEKAEEPCGWCEDCQRRYEEAGNEWEGDAAANLDAKLVCIECFRKLIKYNGYH